LIRVRSSKGGFSQFGATIRAIASSIDCACAHQSMCQSCSSYNACRRSVAFGCGGLEGGEVAGPKSASRCPTPPGRGIGVRRYLRDPLGSGVCVSTVSIVSGLPGYLAERGCRGPQTVLTVLTVFSTYHVPQLNLNLISVLNTDWKRRRRPPERARTLWPARALPENLMALLR
jgi:hypothetical protein